MYGTLKHQQVDMITGDDIDGSNPTDWTTECSPMLVSDSDDSDASYDSGANGPSDDSYIPHPTPSGKKRKATKAPNATFSSLSVADTFERIKKYAGYLEALFLACDPNNSPRTKTELITLRKNCAELIQGLKKIHKREWSDPQWKKCLQDTGFVSAFWQLEFVHIDPNFQIPPPLLPLWRQNKIFDNICCILLLWFHAAPDFPSSTFQRVNSSSPSTPSESSRSANSSTSSLNIMENLPKLPYSTLLPHSPTQSLDFSWGKKNGENLVKILLQFPALIPLHISPSSIFFLCSKDNFWEAWNDWLCVGLKLRGVTVNPQATKRQVSSMFRAIMRYIRNHESDWNDIIQPYINNTLPNDSNESAMILLKSIFYYTARNSRLRNWAKDKIYHHLPKKNCQSCADVADHLKCRVHLPKQDDVNYKTIDKLCKDKKAILLTKAKFTDVHEYTKHPKKKMQSPSGLHLHRKCFEKNTRKTCGKQVYFYYESNPETDEKAAGFYAFNAFPKEIFQLLQTLKSSPDTPTVRDAQAGISKTVAGGSMSASGARTPTGGAIGDTYGYYIHQTASSIEGIKELMDIALKESILREGTRLYLPHIVKNLEKDRSPERLGRSGVTLYSASGYISSLHRDKDHTDGYCWCEAWKADRDTDDFAFVLGGYGYYFCTEANCLWSFNGNKAHATLYPNPKTSSIPSSSAPSSSTPSSSQKRGHRQSKRIANRPENQDENAAQHVIQSKVSRGDHGTKTRRNVRGACGMQKMKSKRPQLKSHLFN